MIELPPPEERTDGTTSFLDTFLRDALPEIKLALGELIDRENARALPERYAKLLPESVLMVTLRSEAAAAIAPLAETMERDLTDSVMRHGSLYDRTYRVQLRRSEDPEAPLYRVSAHAGHAPGPEVPSQPESAGFTPSAERRPEADLTEIATEASTEASTQALPVADPDATRIDESGPPGWAPGQWVLVVENLEGEELEVFRIAEPFTTLGRRTEDPELQTTIALAGVPHLSRRQLVLVFEERNGEPGFKVYNLGLNSLHTPEGEVVGARVGRGALQLDQLREESVGWVRPGTPMRNGDHGPVLRIDEVPPDQEEDEPVDPDATVHD